MFSRIRRVLPSIQSKEIARLDGKRPSHDLPQHSIAKWANSLDPYAYTSGQWLKSDALQLEARHVKFDFQALCKKAIDACPGAAEIVNCEKKEGAFNRAFILQMDNGQRVVARIPFVNSGPRRLVTNSEVATMAYVRSNSNIPVPKVLDWSDDMTNPIGTEYIIMEHASGVGLHRKWLSMDTHQHMLCVKSLTKLVQEMANLSFPAYGSLYFSDAPIDPTSRIDFVEGFCIGPHCGAPAWPRPPDEVDSCGERMPHRGPWTDLESYCTGLIQFGFSQVPKVDPPYKELDYRGTVQEHIRLLKASDEVIKELIKSPIIQNISVPTLMHPDLHKRNIYVQDDDPTIITSIIDWQSTGIDPILFYANEIPDLITSPIEYPSFLEEPETPDGEPEDEEKIRHEKDVSICRKTFDITIQGWVPTLHEARATDVTLLRVFRYCSSSWRNSATSLRQQLIDVSARWGVLGFPGSCPYQPSKEELETHEKQYEDLEASAKLKRFLVHLTDSNPDGWVHPEDWDAAKEANRKAFEEWMQTVKESSDPDMSEEKARKLWPFDVD